MGHWNTRRSSILAWRGIGGRGELIAECESNLAGTRVGITTWVDNLIDEEPVSRSDSATGTSTYSGWALGYMKVDGEWRIAVRRVKRVRGFFEGDKNCPWQEDQPLDDAVPLLAAPRDVRVGAARLLELLVRQLADEAERYVGQICNAKSALS